MITIKVSITLFCTASISNNITIVSNDDNGKPFQNHVVQFAITSKTSNRINPDEVIFREQIGEGSFGIVHRGEWHGNVVAIKTVPNNTINTNNTSFYTFFFLTLHIAQNSG